MLTQIQTVPIPAFLNLHGNLQSPAIKLIRFIVHLINQSRTCDTLSSRELEPK